MSGVFSKVVGCHCYWIDFHTTAHFLFASPEKISDFAANVGLALKPLVVLFKKVPMQDVRGVVVHTGIKKQLQGYYCLSTMTSWVNFATQGS